MSITRINTNSDSMAAIAQLNSLQGQLSKTTAHLSTGLRITSGADDPSGVAIAAKFSSQLSGLAISLQNAQDSNSLLAVADGAMNDTIEILGRMRDLALKGSNGLMMDSTTATALNNEFVGLAQELDRRSAAITFNGKNLLNGTFSTAAGQIAQIGPNNGSQYQLTIQITSTFASGFNAVALGIISTGGIMLDSVAATNLVMLSSVDSAISALTTAQAAVGVQELKLSHIINDLSSQSVNIAAAKSRITDTDMASEISQFTKLQVLAQVGTAMIAQANSQPQTILSLLGLK